MAASERVVPRLVTTRLSLVAGGAAVGIAVGLLLTAALTFYGGSPGFGTRKTFALGALVVGFAMLGWSGSVLAGRGIENLERRLGGSSDWTEADSRRAMARIGGLGVGMMIASAVLETVF